MNKLKLSHSLVLTLAVMLLTACGNTKNNSDQAVKTAKTFPSAMPKKKVHQGGTLKIAAETDTPFTGIFTNTLSTAQIDRDVVAFGQEALFATDDNYQITDRGAAILKTNVKQKTITIKVKPGIKWSDGKEVVAKDVEYPYEIIANKQTKSQRYTGSIANIQGISEYHNGQSPTISGIKMPDGPNGKTVVIHFKKMKPGMSQSGNGYFWENAEPYHYLKNVPFNKLESCDQIRKKPLFFGPFQVEKVVRGQSITWTPNKYYWRGKPKLAKIVISTVAPNSVSQAIKNHKFDVADVINTQWTNVKNTKNVTFVANLALQYHYLSFKVGKWDSHANKNVMNPNAKMNNKSLRQAIGYAMNIDAVNKRYTNGLTFYVPTLVLSQFGDYFDKNARKYNYNLKKANKLLDQAGYKKKGKWRTQPNGKPLTITFAAMSGDTTQEPIVQNYLQQWHKIGLNVKLLNDRLTEFNSFYDKVQHDDPKIDMFLAGWALSTEPSPNDYYNEKAPYNYGRFVTAKNNRLLAEIDSEKSFDHSYRVKKFHEWQRYMLDQAYVLPVDDQYKITAVNDKISGYSKKPSWTGWYNVGFNK
ncbi:oligopeptide ABC transporter substrate-binding protein [Lactobacillus sp. ESL0681]|uniref:oligopeptide ABC transporter substrate-binding protein n=1 Tax=Lactobacillus sp. ESL0681 TaxID=2983211 RepID=UPI0023F65C21|nr:oligopeptide ABC transporter substrate-binding protein [Lactobacillus sp. ESL0681]WEV39858.1 oligopeptide ABC transporter substrate-binding protein [Lactobacillus sp. ESL0681]